MSKYPSLLLVFSLWIAGMIATIAAGAHQLYPWLSVVLLLPITALLFLLYQRLKSLPHTTFCERILLGCLLVIWTSHLIQCFTPETGFDAVWYHLPVIRLVVEDHGLIYQAELYQSINPLFSDLIFLLGFQWAGDMGAKLVAYLMALSLAIVSYALSRLYLSRGWALVATIGVSLMQVVTWQSASVYIDVAKALWELSALYLLVMAFRHQKGKSLTPDNVFQYLLLAGLLFGASLGSKLFSLLLLPSMLLIVWLLFHQWKHVVAFLTVSISVALPFYVWSYLNTGDPFFALSHHLNTFESLGGFATPLQQFVQKLLRLPLSFLTVLTVRDYVSPLLMLVLPLLIWFAISWKKIRFELKILGLFVASQWIIWWMVPPLSTRYALSGFIVLLILVIIFLEKMAQRSNKWRGMIYVCLGLMLLATLAPRLYVNLRSWQYISGAQTKEQYLEQFYDGSIDEKLRNWHELE